VKAKLQLQQKHQTKKVIHPVEKGLKSAESGKQYRWHFNAFIKWLESKFNTSIVDEMILQLDIHELENLLIEYLDEYLYKQKHLKHATIKSAEAAVSHFCSMNDVLLNTSKISKFLPADENSNQDRAYTRKEIEKLLENADMRYKVVILLMANGMRIGALSDLQLGDLTPISVGNSESQQQQKVYRIWVYARSKNSRYFTFVTPECANAIDDYLKFRKEQGEDITVESSPLIREQFKLNDRKQAANPQKMSQTTLEKNMERIVKRAGTNTVHKVMITHGFRKFAITQMAKAKVDFSDREYLVGHKFSRGLDVNYHRTTEDEKLIEWSKAINFLTIDPAHHLQHELKLIQGETNQKIAQQDQEIASLKNNQKRLIETMDKQGKIIEHMTSVYKNAAKEGRRPTIDEMDNELLKMFKERNKR
jgi:integrase